ncbi:MAG: DUF1460 domain-containing protein [Nitrospirae bacterium]|nr:DUF1460 domain-containing protein [Nitrospirota bacterium]
MREQIILGKWTREKLDDLLKESSSINDAGKRIDFLSGKFLGLEYRESTLIGDINTPEIFVINLKGVDCFTFLDYTEAMRISKSFAEFKENLKKVRYQSGNVVYENRNHFFADWIEFNSDLVEEATEYVCAGKSHQVKKILNQNNDGTCFLPGIPCRERKIVYIHSGDVDNVVIEKLKTGDYIGIYSEKPGLDVSHVGIVIKVEDNIFLRHASINSTKVVDEDFLKYISDKPGIIVLRPKEFS